MKSKTKITVIIGLSLLGVGFILTIVAIAAGATMEKAVYIVDKNVGIYDDSIDIYEDWSHGGYYMEEKELTLWENSYPAEAVTKFNLDVSAAEVQIIPGERFAVKSATIPCSIRFDNGRLSIETKAPRWNWIFSRPWKNRKIVITIPEQVRLDSLTIHVGAGELVSKSVEFFCDSANIEVGMGECDLYNLNVSKNTNIECGMGSIDIRGRIEGIAKVNCGMGEIDMKLKGDIQDYSYNASVGMGSVRINKTHIDGIGGKTESPYRGKHELTLDCGMGEINVQITE